MFSPINSSLYERLPLESGISSFNMVVTQDAQPTVPEAQQRPSIPVTSPLPERNLSTAPTVMAELGCPTSPTIVGDETLPPSPAATLVEEILKEPCIAFEKDYDPTANPHQLARQLVQARLAKGHDRSELLKEQLLLREKATIGKHVSEDDDDDRPLTGGIWKSAPHVQSPEYVFYTAVILTLENNPVMFTPRRGVRSWFPLPTLMMGLPGTGAQKKPTHGPVM